MTMEKLRAELTAFIQQIYEEDKKVLVFGEGDPMADVAMVGEAPGEQEALLGRPFVGKAGKNLDAFLGEADIPRSALYVTNTVKFRPTKISTAGRTVNRPPTQEEVKLFLPWLEKELEIVNPRCVITLGNVPLKALAGRKRIIGEEHGRFITLENGRLIYPMYHPASIIYNPSLKEVYSEDVRRFGEWYRGEGQ